MSVSTPVPPREHVVAVTADQAVVAVIAGEGVGRRVADQIVIAVAAGGVLDDHAIGDGVAAEDVVGERQRRRRSACNPASRRAGRCARPRPT